MADHAEPVDRDDFTGIDDVTDDDLTDEQHAEADQLLAEHDPDEWDLTTHDRNQTAGDDDA